MFSLKLGRVGMSSYKEYRFQHQKRHFELRVYSMHMCVKLFMDGTLREMSVPNMTTKPLLKFSFYDERKQEHKITVERKHHWLKYHYTVFIMDKVFLKHKITNQ